MKIGLAVFPGCVASGLFAFAELLEAANRRSGKNTFEVIWVGIDLEPVPITIGQQKAPLSLNPEMVMTDGSLDAVLLPGFWTDGELKTDKVLASKKTLLASLKQIPSATDIWSYCSSVCLLAETGRLENKEATSTWWLADYLQKKYSNVHWRFTQTCIVDAGISTASGVNGYLPIAQALITRVCGQDVMRDIVDLMVIPRPEKTNQPFQNINLMFFEDKLLRQIYVWVEKMPATELLISNLAKTLHLTERTVSRKVKAATTLSCAHFMRLIKMHQASEYLIYSSDSIQVISERLGFSDDAAFRRTFKSASSYTPSDYRQTFKR
jgi:transcriptional regulator GlxA family with amidase domain